MKLNITSAAWAIILFLLPIIVVSLFRPYYYWSFDRYEVYQNFDRPEAAPAFFGQVLGTIRPPFSEVLDHRWFSTEDIIHMQDVQNIFVVIYVVALLALAIALGGVFKMQRKYELRERLEKIWGTFIAIISLISLASFFLWNQAFTFFHETLFPNNQFWMLDPSTSNLIKYLPEVMFQELLVIVIALWIVEWLVLNYVFGDLLETRLTR